MASSNRLTKIRGSMLVEVLLAVALFAVLAPMIISGVITSRQGEPQSQQRLQANALLREMNESLRVYREHDWNTFAQNGTFHPAVSGNTWVLVGGTDTVGDFSRSIIIANAYRDASGNLSVGGTLDPSVKKVTATISWQSPVPDFVESSYYLTRYLDNLAYINTTFSDFSVGTTLNTAVGNSYGGEVTIAQNTKAKWCSPELSSSTIDLPDGPPVAVAATASASTAQPNDVYVATAPSDNTSVKMAYVNVTANSDNPTPSLAGTFTLDPAKYSDAGLVPTSIGISNNSFKTNDIKFYTSPANNRYALIATDLPDKEIIAVQIKANGVDTFQDSVNKIYRYKTFFNTRQYQGDSRSTPNQDQTPFGYGAVALTVFGPRGYLVSGGYLYVFDLSNIDSKNATTGLDMVGCRIELDGYDCQPGSGTDRKYSSNETGASWSNTTSPAHNDCSDGGNIELYADRMIALANSGTSTYAYIAVGAGVNPELDVVNVTSVPSSSTNPRINASGCGRISGGASGWKVSGTLDFDTYSGTEEAANSIYARNDGNRVYMTSNGGIMHNNIPDSNQFYIIDTSNKSSPKFLTSWPSTVLNPPPGHYSGTAASGYYNGNATNIELYPRRSLTVLNGQRAVVVGHDGIDNAVEPQEYQVLNLENESTPTYCGGINYLPGFNDLTSVTEADGDNFVYMVANTTDHQLKIIQGGPDGRYNESGTYISRPFDTGTNSAFNRISIGTTVGVGTSAMFQVSVANAVANSCIGVSYDYLGPDGTSASYFMAGTTVIPLINAGNYQNPGRCFSYKALMSTTDYNLTPILNDVTVNYSP